MPTRKPKVEWLPLTGENLGQNTSMQGNPLNPSVQGPVEDPTTDSMFNLADPQTRELEEEITGAHESRRGMKKKRASKSRKTA